MSFKISESSKKQDRNRNFHLIIALAFCFLVATGAILFLPALSQFAADSWTRLIHRIFAAVLISAIFLYSLIKPGKISQWIKDMAFWIKREKDNPDAWKRKHKALVVIGLAVLIITGAIQWFLKGIIPNQVFRISILIHDIAFFYVFVVFLLHLYHEFDWWFWKKEYCNRCYTADCADICPMNSISITNKGLVSRDDRCNNCRLCMKDCQRHSYHLKTAVKNKLH